MIVKEYVKTFETYGLGMFVHFGLYSLIGRGEWAKHSLGIPDEEYEPLAKVFCPDHGWADNLARTAKEAGCRYITLTTRHHDGFSLYDTCGITDYDIAHGAEPGRDLVREFTDACRKYGIIPFFYHTLLDWHRPEYRTDFPAYLRYLRESVEVLCTRYGKIGGFWFDGKWNRPQDDWEEDALYAMIRSHQPDAMLINNSGMDARGALGHIELDSVTFERGKPKPINLDCSPKYIASEMCQIFGDHWGFAENDLNFKSPAAIIEDLAACRKVGSNFLINVGPRADGSIRPADLGALSVLGRWTEIFGEAIRTPRPFPGTVDGGEKDFVLRDGSVKTCYLFVHGLPVNLSPAAFAARKESFIRAFDCPEKPLSAVWMDNGEALDFSWDPDGKRIRVLATPYPYGTNLVVRVAKITF